MKVTRKTLRKIIQEETRKLQTESSIPPMGSSEDAELNVISALENYVDDMFYETQSTPEQIAKSLQFIVNDFIKHFLRDSS